MRRMFYIILVGVIMLGSGCSTIGTVERENLVDPQLRADYIDKHPAGRFNQNIMNGEITRGMESDEVIASWGFPNVLLVDNESTSQYWVYYTSGADAGSVHIYTLNFDNSNLVDWDIDIKRFSHFSLDNNIYVESGNKITLTGGADAGGKEK